jgi:hypothetical protein
MAVGDEHRYSDGRVYVETEWGPNIWWTCTDCGAPAAACFEYTGVVRCSGCWPKFHGIVPQRTVNANKDLVSDGR